MGLILFFMLNLILLGPIVCMSTSSWLIYWIGMEFGLMGLIPIMLNSNAFLMSEAAMKYFLVQAMASILLFFGGVFTFMLVYSNLYSTGLLMMSLLIKLGMFPFHYWVVPVMSSIWYPEMMLILIPMKVPSFALINYISNSGLQILLFFVSVSSMMMGSFLGNNCANVRSMLGASSISHSGWVSMSSLVGGLWFYFVLYSSVLLLSLFFIWFNSSFLSAVMILSLSGLPPFLLFSVKFYILMMMIKSGYMLILLIIPVLSALISLNFYLKSSYFFYLNSKKLLKLYLMLGTVVLNLLGTFSILLLL